MIEEKLKNMIIEKSGSVKSFSAFINIPYTTLDSILKRGIDKANVLNIIKICNALNIDVDSLANGKIEKKMEVVNTTLTAAEQNHIEKYRKLDAYGKDMVDTVLDKEAARVSAQEDAFECAPIAARDRR